MIKRPDVDDDDEMNQYDDDDIFVFEGDDDNDEIYGVCYDQQSVLKETLR